MTSNPAHGVHALIRGAQLLTRKELRPKCRPVGLDTNHQENTRVCPPLFLDLVQFPSTQRLEEGGTCHHYPAFDLETHFRYQHR